MIDLGTTLTIVTSVANLVLGSLVLFSNPKKKLNVYFAVFSLVMSAWVFSNYIFSTQHSLFVLKTQYVLGGAIMPTAFMWIFSLLETKNTRLKILLFSVIGFIFTFLPYVDDMIVKNLEGSTLVTGYLFYYYSILTLVLYVILISVLVSGIITSTDTKKTQLKYILAGALIFGGTSMVVNFVLPFFKIVPVAPYDAQSSIFFVVLSTYAITKHNLFNIKVIATELLAFAIWMALLVNIFSSGNLQDFLINSAVFIAVIIAGILLIRSVIKEVQQREEIEKLAKELERAYTIEKKAKEELEKLDKFKDQFLMTTQHNLRTPLTAMRGYTDLVLNGTFGKQPKKTVEVMGKLKTLTDGMIKMVNDFLDMAKFQLGKDVVTLKPNIELLPILDEVIVELEFVAKQKEVDLKLEKPNTPITITADREKLKAALFNIVDNSIKYTPKGSVTIKFEIRNSKFEIIVIDTGIGIPKERLGTLFQSMFERGAEAQKVSTTGSGIGLYLSGQIIKSHKGKVWAESEGQGKGSVFHIELPLG